jgi:hypothetical protein
MSLTWGGVKQLMRLQAVAEQFAAVVQEGEESGDWRDTGRGVGRVLDELVGEVHAALRDADPGLADEFERVVIDITAPPLSLAGRAAILTGWLEGAVEAEMQEVRIRAGAGQSRARKVGSDAVLAR